MQLLISLEGWEIYSSLMLLSHIVAIGESRDVVFGSLSHALTEGMEVDMGSTTTAEDPYLA